jgi:hypothetical protein
MKPSTAGAIASWCRSTRTRPDGRPPGFLPTDKLELDEHANVITLATPGGNRVVLSDKDKSILLEAENGNTAKLGPAGNTLDSARDVSLTA